ncbi:DNA repair protein RadA [Antrihabitans spumae]|uniref:DNA repair protein RadA n=1 Tax=Antrihabitans spumae TaxID=3373370 RepID=A0ABW7K8A6_9NOCA
MAKPKSSYRCSSCQHTVAKWVGKCPDCGTWGSVDEVPILAAVGTARGIGAQRAAMLPSTPATPITQVDGTTNIALPTGVGELDRVLGGGIVPGSVVLLAGEPGVGKSTLLLEVVHQWARRAAGERALYVTGEESAGQVRLRADRTGAVHERVYLASESDLVTVLGHVEQVGPTLVIVDSVQTMSATDVDGVIGGVTQVRAVTTALTSLAKASGIAVLLVGHVTKEGAVAGPRTLEHLVDVVLNFEGDRHSTLRMLRGIKNRFGASDEVGCFELHEDGIEGISDPSGLFLHNRANAVPGTAVAVTMDGKRPMLGEIQALTTPSQMPTPRRAVSGLDYNRVAMMLAVLESRVKKYFSKHEVYVSTVAGMRITEPSADLAIAVALASTLETTAMQAGTVVIGEVGLTGEVRRVSNIGRRLAEAQRLGFTRAVVPLDHGPIPAGIKAIPVADLGEALREAIPGFH